MNLESNIPADSLYFERLQQACELQDGLMVTFLSMVTRSSGKLLLRSILRQTLEGLAKLTFAEESSLFWLDEQGYVAESILARGIAIREQKETVVGQVLENGLAGWVYRQREIGVIEDTAADDRWLELPYQPYDAKSILCFPIMRGSHLLAIATLMHSEIGFFNQEKAKLIELCATKLGMVLDLLRVQIRPAQEIPEQKPDREETDEFKSISQFVLSEDGKLISADPRLAELFNYESHELVEINSFFDLVADTHQEAFAKKMAECFEGKQSQLLVTFRGLSKEGQSLKVEFYGYRAKLFGNVAIAARIKVL
ncbi:GAF domain protein [[Leptolyngbya] sp. PCC 7376]|uniref:GAF domain-containing protein n=1 Tax=[Leptolyngbya] sp. PCC 7376 TaxID=111781 RepID=UPI00029EE87A|nr:GAF domain-containing protein [[Leptolyngbya] sp. PCC 7376]AFY40537.1 GAF domain protein [[Leptolyngbya] sp. PCC 7376]